MSTINFSIGMKKVSFYARVVSTVFILLIVVCCSYKVHAESDENLDRLIQQRNLERLRLKHKQQATLNQIGITEKRTVRVLEALKVLADNIDRSQKKLNRLKQKIFLLKKQILKTSLKIGQLEIDIEKDKKEINQQLQALYYLGRVRKMTLFIGLNSFENYFRNQKLLQNSTQLDIQLLNRLNQNLSDIQVEKNKLDTQRLVLDTLKSEEEALNKLLEFERQQQVTYLRHLKTNRSAHIRYLRDIQVELEQLNDNLYSLAIKKENRKKTKQFQGFRTRKYKLPSPVIGKIVHRFGQQQSPFYTLFRRGVLVETNTDRPVHAILSGKVVWAGPFRGYQNLVILDHGKGSLSVYGNLSELFVLVDDVIDQGYVLGSVALDRVEKRSLFYFEMRYNKKAVNPARWLKKPQWRN